MNASRQVNNFVFKAVGGEGESEHLPLPTQEF